MAVYVDQVRSHFIGNATKQVQKHGDRWCHMWTDDNDLTKLHEMAEKIGLKRSFFQPDKRRLNSIYHLPHYDLVPSKRVLALEHGAVEREPKELFAERRKATMLSQNSKQ